MRHSLLHTKTSFWLHTTHTQRNKQTFKRNQVFPRSAQLTNRDLSTQCAAKWPFYNNLLVAHWIVNRSYCNWVSRMASYSEMEISFVLLFSGQLSVHSTQVVIKAGFPILPHCLYMLSMTSTFLDRNGRPSVKMIAEACHLSAGKSYLGWTHLAVIEVA